MWAAFLRAMSRLSAIVHQRRDDGELDQEMEAHRALLVDDYLRRGLSEDEARRAAHGSIRSARCDYFPDSGTSIRIVPSWRDVMNNSPSRLALMCRSDRVTLAPIVRSMRSRSVT